MTHELTSAPNWLFSVQLYQPAFCNTASAIQSLRVRLLSTIASIRFLCFFFFLKSTRPFFYKAGCTRQFESELSFRSLAPLFPIKEGIISLLVLLQQSIRPSLVLLFPGDRNLREEEKTAPPVALIRCAIWLTGHLRFRQSVCAEWYRIGNYAPVYSIRCSVSAYIISFSQLIY